MTATFDSIGHAPAPDEIRVAVDRIVMSDVFSRSPQLGAFLRFVVEAVLHGRAGRIKAYTIGVEVLRRDTSFDPQIDPIVRVEATRLRRAIERYYAGPGMHDPIVLDLPRGTYVPTFQRREPDSEALPAGLRGWFGSRGVAATAVVAVALLIAGGVLLSRTVSQRAGAVMVTRGITAPPSAERSLAPGNGMPTVHIEPLRVAGTPPGGLSANALLEKLNGAFALFDTVNVIDPPRSTDGSGASVPPPRSDYRLSGVVEHRDGKSGVQLRLTDASEGNVVWSHSYDGIAASRDGSAEAHVVGAVSEALLQSYGVIRARDRAKHLASNLGDPRYRCILEAADSFRTLRETEHERARHCLEKLTAADPSFAVGYAFLALIYSREYQHGLGARAGDTPPLERALQAVRRSIELNPASARAYVVLMVVLFHRREVDEAFAAGAKAMTMNKYDMLGPAEYGGRRILVGDVEEGMSMLRRAGQFGAIRPAWQHFYMFMGAYLGNDLKEAAYQSGQITAEGYAPTHLARALVAVAAGDMERARQAVERLVAVQPSWRDDVALELAKLSPSPAVVRRVALDLARAGLPGP